jgi:hypothetical protein
MQIIARVSWLRLFLLSLLFTLASFLTANAQTEFRHVGGYDYGLWEDGWHRTQNNVKGDLLDPGLLVVRLKDRGLVEGYNFEHLGLPMLEIYKGRRVEGFYTLRVPEDQDPFELARVLDESEDFEYVFFTGYRQVNSAPNDSLFESQWNRVPSVNSIRGRIDML